MRGREREDRVPAGVEQHQEALSGIGRHYSTFKKLIIFIGKCRYLEEYKSFLWYCEGWEGN
jgi:hypothetical protein